MLIRSYLGVGLIDLFFLERHFLCHCVKGSLPRWKENESNVDFVWDILGCNDEVIENDNIRYTVQIHDETNVNVNISETDVNVKTSNAINIPMNSSV